MGAFQVGKRFELFRIDNSDAYENKIPVGSVHTGTDYKGLGADINSAGLTKSDKLYFSYNTNVVDNANCTKVGALIITRLK